MDLLDFLSDIVIYGFPDLVDDKKISHKTRKRILAIFIIVSLCHIGISAFCIFWGIKSKSVILLILGIICILLFLFEIVKTVKNYKESQEKWQRNNNITFHE